MVDACAPSSYGELIGALRSYQQADEDGIMVLVSRQACDESATAIATLTAERDALKAELQARDEKSRVCSCESPALIFDYLGCHCQKCGKPRP